LAEKLNRFERYLSSNLGYGSSSFSYKQLLLFTEKLLAQIQAGQTLPDALDAVFETTGNRVQRMVLFSVANAVKSGTPLSQAMLTFKDVFPNFYIAMIMATERSGKMVVGLEAIRLHLRNENKMFDYYNVSLFYLRMIIYALLGGAIYTLVRLELFTFSLENMLYTTSGVAFIILLAGWVYRYIISSEMRKEKILNLIPLAGKIHHFSKISTYCFLYNVFQRSGVPIPQINGLLINYLGDSYLVQDIQKLANLIKSKPDPDRLPKYFTVLPDTLAREIILFEQEKTKYNTILNYSQFISAEIDDMAEQILSLEKRFLLGLLGIGAVVVYLSLIY